jgi:hypothetical protein
MCIAQRAIIYSDQFEILGNYRMSLVYRTVYKDIYSIRRAETKAAYRNLENARNKYEEANRILVRQLRKRAVSSDRQRNFAEDD